MLFDENPKPVNTVYLPQQPSNPLESVDKHTMESVRNAYYLYLATIQFEEKNSHE